MKITKIGHCCLLIEHNDRRILTDPGAYAQGYEHLRDIDIMLITHEHADHMHIPALEILLKQNPNARIITNDQVGKILETKNIKFDLVAGGSTNQFDTIRIQAFGANHATIYKDFGLVGNTGFLIENRLFYPGDAFIDPECDIEILALPVEGPWMKLSEAMEYAIKLAPKICFPVHDGRLRPDRIGTSHSIPKTYLPKHGIEFVPLKESESHDFK